MRTRFWIFFLVLILLGAGFQGCRSTLELLTKNAKRTIINTQNKQYDLIVKINYSTGNKQSSFLLGPDSVTIKNKKLTDVIKGLSGNPTTRLVYRNKHPRKKMKLDITYYYKAPYSNKAPQDSLMNILSKRLDFTILSDTVPTPAP